MASPFVIKCENCGENLTENSDRKRCSNCKLVYYCDAKCQKDNWSKHKSVCKKKINLSKDALFILGHSRLIEEVFRIPKGVNLLTYNKCGTPLVSHISMEDCLDADRCEMGLKPHIYMGDSNDVIMDMNYNFEPFRKFKVDGKLFTDRDKFIIVGLKLIREDTSLEMMEFRDGEYDEVSINSKFYHWKLDNPEYQDKLNRHMEKELKKIKGSKSEEVAQRIFLEYEEKEYQKFSKTPDAKRTSTLGVTPDDPRLFLLSELFIQHMSGKKKPSKEERQEIYKFFSDRKFNVRLSEIIKFVTEKSKLNTISVNGCRTFPSFQQERFILPTSLKGRPKRMLSNRNSKPRENNRFRYTDKVFMDESLPPLTPVRLGEYLESKGQILERYNSNSLAPACRMKTNKKKKQRKKKNKGSKKIKRKN